MTLSGDARPGYEAFRRAARTNGPADMLGQVTARFAPHVLRLALLYAVLDRGYRGLMSCTSRPRSRCVATAATARWV